MLNLLSSDSSLKEYLSDKLFFENVISLHCELDLSADRFHWKYRRLRKYPNNVNEVCKFRNKTVFRQLLESLLLTYAREDLL